MESIPHTQKRTLIVLLHAYRSSPPALESARKVACEAYPSNAFIVPRLHLRTFSRADLVKETDDLVEKIDDAWKNGGFEQIVLVGHSLGALLARKIYVAACGENHLAPFEHGLKRWVVARKWAVAVERIVLLAGMNRGWSISHHMGVRRALSMWAGTILNVLFPGRFAIFQSRRGAPFVTNLRVQWLRMRQRAKASGGPGSATVVQLLGTKDDVVSPHDNVDLFAGRDFVYRDMPHSGHSDVIDMSSAPRAQVFKEALTTRFTSQDLNRPWDPDLDTVIRTDVTDVVFVMHGIRDEGYWTNRIAREVLRKSRERNALAPGSARVFATETSSYGYFGMGPFLIPSQRRKRVEWFMDAYGEAIARYPCAERFYYVGHSHGTYMVAKALELYPCCRFKRIVFAGSVARTDYEWNPLLNSNPPQVEGVLNLVGTRDWVVAYFPKFLEQLDVQDVGGAGYTGFAEATESGPVFQRCLEGGHSIGISEPAWPAIADFLLVGLVPAASGPPVEPESPLLYSKTVGRQPVLAWMTALLLAGVIFFVVLVLTRNFPTAAAAAFFATILVKILTSA